MFSIKKFSPFFCFLALLLSQPSFGQTQFIHLDSLSGKQKSALKISHLAHENGPGLFSLRLTVQDSASGKYVTGLAGKSGKDALLKIVKPVLADKCADFTVTELDEKTEVTEPLNIAIALDYSGSMEGYFDTLKVMAEKFIKSLDGNLFTRINFDDNLERKPINAEPTKTPQSVSLDKFSDYGGGTALYRAIFDGIETLSKAKGNRVLVVFTDGFENSSGIAMQAVWEKAKEQHVSVYAVGFDIGGYDRLDSLCTKTGGKYYAAQGMSERVFEGISGGFSHHYILKVKCKDKLAYPIEIATKGLGSNNKLSIPDPQKIKGFDPESIGFHSFLFDHNTTTLIRAQRKGFKSAIAAIADHLIANPNDHIVIEGHASPEGDSLKNLRLSRDRADFVYQEVLKYLATKYRRGPNKYQAVLARNRIKAEFYGQEKWLFPATSYKNYENRRVEVKTY